ncbi:MAG: TIM barrel protein, partial [Candidatus Thermoplasmatota archaeon]
MSCKGRTLRDGIEDVHNLGLTSMEVQLVRVNVLERPAGEEEIGQTPRTIPGELVVEVRRKAEKKDVRIPDLDVEIEPGDALVSLTSGLARDYEELRALGQIAKEMDIELSLHTPYYMDLAGPDQLAQRSMDSVMWGGLLADAMGAAVVATFLGLYGEMAEKEALKRIQEAVKALRDGYRQRKLKVKLGLETSGRREVVGSLDEILSLCKAVKGVVPVLNFAHVHAREGGILKRPEDFEAVIDRTEKAAGGHVHAHFTGVETEGGSELRYTPIKKGDLRFEPLAECLLDNDYDLTLVSSSPLLEHDAMYMK